MPSCIPAESFYETRKLLVNLNAIVSIVSHNRFWKEVQQRKKVGCIVNVNILSDPETRPQCCHCLHFSPIQVVHHSNHSKTHAMSVSQEAPRRIQHLKGARWHESCEKANREQAKKKFNICISAKKKSRKSLITVIDGRPFARSRKTAIPDRTRATRKQHLFQFAKE